MIVTTCRHSIRVAFPCSSEIGAPKLERIWLSVRHESPLSSAACLHDMTAAGNTMLASQSPNRSHLSLSLLTQLCFCLGFCPFDTFPHLTTNTSLPTQTRPWSLPLSLSLRHLLSQNEPRNLLLLHITAASSKPSVSHCFARLLIGRVETRTLDSLTQIFERSES